MSNQKNYQNSLSFSGLVPQNVIRTKGQSGLALNNNDRLCHCLLLFLTQPRGTEACIMQHIEIQGIDIHSLIELRKNFDLKEVSHAFLDGTLVQWLSDCYYEREAATLEQIPREDLPIIEEKLCKVLGVDYMKYAQVTPAQLSAYTKKRECVLQYTDNTEILNRLDEVATTQVELAQLLNIGAKTIYLCGTSFSIPIRKIGVHYIGIGNPIIDSPFTEEQYRRAGVTFEKVTLPSKGADEMQHLAEEAAAMNGYDDYGNDHSRLSTMVHNRLKISSRSVCCHLETDPDDVMMEFFKSKSKADKSAQDIINTAYDEANAFFTPGQGTCIAAPLAVEYENHIKENMFQIVKLLSRLTREVNLFSTWLRNLKK